MVPQADRRLANNKRVERDGESHGVNTDSRLLRGSVFYNDTVYVIRILRG